MSGEHEYRVDGEPEHDEPVELAQALGEWAAAHHPGRTYVTEVSVPQRGDGGTQRLHSQMLREPDREREAGI
jgi:hypothetical protein